jgi:hypothetical protein
MFSVTADSSSAAPDAAEQETGSTERNGTCHREVATRHVHDCLLDRSINTSGPLPDSAYRPASACFILTIASMCSRGESPEPIVFTDRWVAPRSRHCRARCAHSAGPPME